LKQLQSTSMACTALARESGERPIIGAMTIGAIGGFIPRRFDDNLRRVGSGRTPGRASEYSGGSDPCVSRIGCEITWKQTVGGEIAIVVAAVVIPAAGVAIAQHRPPVVLREYRCHCKACQKDSRGRYPNSRFDHAAPPSHQGRIVPQSPFHPSSRPLRNCR
jgi:hypothetical protein